MQPKQEQNEILKALFGENKKETPQSLLLPIKVNLVITDINNLPAIQLRRSITNIEQIKVLSLCAMRDLPCLIYPSFNDKLRSIAQLVNKGILYQKDGEFYFNF